MKHFITLLTGISFLFFTSLSFSQSSIWKTVDDNFQIEKKTTANDNTLYFKLVPELFSQNVINAPDRFKYTTSSSLISLPNLNGDLEIFKVFEASNFSEELSDKYPTVKSYIAKSLKSNKTARISYEPKSGFNAYIYEAGESTLIIKPYDVKQNIYRLYSRLSLEEEFNAFECNTIQKSQADFRNNNIQNRNADDSMLRQYRAAISTTGEYAQYFLDGTEVDDAERITKVLAAINTSLMRINGIFERDFSITMQLIANNDQVIFLDPSTDPYNGPSNALLQNTLDNIIGDVNYDVGHLFAYEGAIYGNAGCIACVCTTGSKGSGYTVHSAPESDNFNMIASHEFGHQFGGWHVQSSSNCRSANGLNEVEPGSGSTIMGYAGICSPNVQNGPDDYFNYVNIRDIAEWTINGSSCAQVVAIPNAAPVANAGNDYIIPISTPFILEGIGSDPDASDMLSYNWEQNNPENPFSSNTPSSTWSDGPLFRSRLPLDVPNRYLPQISDIVNGDLTPTWEVLPSISRNLNFVFTVRDNAIGGGQTASDEMSITVDNNFGPFTVTSQAAAENWDVGESALITWDVANTTNAPISAANVDILLSVDGGYTYPYSVTTTANDGSESIVIPNVPTTTMARVMVRASNNIFFAINATDINIQTSEFVMSFDDSNISVCKPDDAVYNFTYNTYLGFSETTTFSVENLPAGAIATFNPNSATSDGTNVQLTISNTSGLPLGQYNMQVKGVSNSVEKITSIVLDVYDSNISNPVLDSPLDNETGISIDHLFEWQDDINALDYEIEIALDASFSNVIDTSTTVNNTYISTLLGYDTTYFWRVRSANECTTSAYSNVNSFTTVCVEPSNLIINTIQVTSAEISWIENGSASSWEIEYGLTGFTQGLGTSVQTTNNPYTISGLTSLTDYDVYVRSNCSGSNTSDWIGPVSFSTAPDFCSGDNFYDSGGSGGNYSNGENEITTIYPTSGFNSITAIFNSFELESCCDFLRIYDGVDTNAPLLGSFNGTTNPGTFVSNNAQGALTFHFTSDGSVVGSGWDVSIICESISCPNPSNLSVSNLAEDSLEINWDAGSTETQWELEYGLTGFTQGSGTLIQTTTNSYTMNTLTSGTTYDVYVRANCGSNPGDDDSSWVGPFMAETAVNYCSGNNFYDSGGVNGNYSNNENEITTIYPTSGFNSITAVFNSFALESCCDFLRIYDGVDTNAPFLGSFNGTTNPGSFMATNPQGALTFHFTSDGSVTGSGWDVSIICESITCPNPSNINISNLTDNSADISWDAGGTETQWEIEYGLTGFIQGSGMTIQTSNNPYSIAGLNAATDYDIYLRAICGTNPGDDDSSWLGPIAFSTNCGAIVAPMSEHFEAFNAVPNCWQQYGSEPWNFDTFADYTAASAGDHTPSGSTNYAWIDGSTPNGIGQISNLRTVTIDVSQLTVPAVQFSVFSHNLNDNSYNTLNVIVHNGNNESENILNLQESTDGWVTYLIPLDNITTNSDFIEIEFIIEENSPGLPYYNDILIDDIIVDSFDVLGTTDLSIEGLVIYPNPVDNELNISHVNSIDSLEVYSLLGQKIIDVRPNQNAYKLDLSYLQSGTYILRVVSGSATKMIKIIKS